ncbi:hypothetical protein TSUD_17700 [Trifolium subterraneum]|uniref:Uncharacterized protein n=1 Tax=Trifolium subterraneum TaxID=3900 RepID=A0A2Z6N7M3_TRISU|nr:hypothetical protein TSUD_17700 [Trifolium subterraneum]
MSPKYISLCLLFGIVLLATTSLADLSGDRSSASDNTWEHKPPKKHWPPMTTKNEVQKVEQKIPQNEQSQEKKHIAEGNHHSHHHEHPWRKHPPSKN